MRGGSKDVVWITTRIGGIRLHNIVEVLQTAGTIVLAIVQHDVLEYTSRAGEVKRGRVVLISSINATTVSGRFHASHTNRILQAHFAVPLFPLCADVSP